MDNSIKSIVQNNASREKASLSIKTKERLAIASVLTICAIIGIFGLSVLFKGPLSLYAPEIGLERQSNVDSYFNEQFVDVPYLENDLGYDVKEYIKKDNIETIRLDCKWIFNSEITFIFQNGRTVTIPTRCDLPFRYAVIKNKGDQFAFYFDDSLRKTHLDKSIFKDINDLVQLKRYEANKMLTIRNSW